MRPPGTLVSLLICVGTVIGASGCNGGSGGADRSARPFNVLVHPAEAADSSKAFAYSGTIEESESIPLSFSGLGSVARVLVSEGDVVRKGQLLATLNDETSRSAYEMSLASQRQAEDAHKRLETMYNNGNLPEIKLVEVASELERVKAATLIAKKNLADCALYSPVDGIVGKRSVEPGMNAIPNVTSITIVKTEKLFARVSVPEQEISLVRKHQNASIRVGALNGATFDGTVEEIGVLADAIAHTYKIRIGITNRNLAIRPGMICDVFLRQTRHSRSVVVPGNAVMVDESERHYVYAVDTNASIALRRQVTPGAFLNDGIEILDGLRIGELVIVSGQHKLVDSAAVRIVGN